MITKGRDVFQVGILTKQEWEPDLAGYGNWAKNELASDISIKCMPPTPMVEDLEYTAKLVDYPPRLNVEFKFRTTPVWNRIYNWWVKIHDPVTARLMANYRQRLSVGSGCLRVAEFEKKFNDYKNNVDALDEIISPHEDLFCKIAHGIKDIKKARVEKLKIGAHTQQFIKDHEDSAVAPGLKWGEMNQSDLEVLLESVLEAQTWQIDNWDDCVTDSDICYALYPLSAHFGGRHRGVKEFSFTKGALEADLTRERIVAYNGSIGGFNAFCEDVSTMYGEIIDFAKGYLFPKTSIICPVVDGGKVYGKLKDALVDGYHYQNVDVSTYDNYAIRICKLAGLHALPCGSLNLMSGADDTSWTGSLGNMELCYAQCIHQDLHPSLLGILGDDSGWVLPENENFTSLPGVQEEDEMGTKLIHYLGFSLLSDEGYFHPTGFKVTGDKARHDMPYGAEPRPWNHSLTANEVAAYEAVFKGVYVTKSKELIPMRVILDGVDLSSHDYVSPSVVKDAIESKILSGALDITQLTEVNANDNTDIQNTDEFSADEASGLFV